MATANEAIAQEAIEPTAIADAAVPETATTELPEPLTPTVTAFSALESLLSRQAEMQAQRHVQFMDFLAEHRQLMAEFREHLPSNNMPVCSLCKHNTDISNIFISVCKLILWTWSTACGLDVKSSFYSRLMLLPSHLAEVQLMKVHQKEPAHRR